MGEEHLDLLPLAARGYVVIGVGNIGPCRGLPRGLAQHLAGRRVWTAARLERAHVTVVLAGAVEQRRAIIDQRAAAGEPFAGRTDIDVAPMIVGEVLAFECPVGSADLSKTGMCGSIPRSWTSHPSISAEP